MLRFGLSDADVEENLEPANQVVPVDDSCHSQAWTLVLLADAAEVFQCRTRMQGYKLVLDGPNAEGALAAAQRARAEVERRMAEKPIGSRVLRVGGMRVGLNALMSVAPDVYALIYTRGFIVASQPFVQPKVQPEPARAGATTPAQVDANWRPSEDAAEHMAAARRMERRISEVLNALVYVMNTDAALVESVASEVPLAFWESVIAQGRASRPHPLRRSEARP